MVKWSAFSMFILWIVGKENMHLMFFVDFHTSMVFLLLLDLSFWLCNVLIGHTNYVHSPFLHIEAVKQWHLCITSYHSTSPISIIGRIIIKPYSVSLIVKRWNRSQCYVAAVHLYNFIDDLYDMVTCITFIFNEGSIFASTAAVRCDCLPYSPYQNIQNSRQKLYIDSFCRKAQKMHTCCM